MNAFFALCLLGTIVAAVPMSPDTFEADVTMIDSLFPFPINSHLFFDYTARMQRMDSEMWGSTHIRIDNSVANLTYIVDIPMPGAQPMCRTCFMDDLVYSMHVPIFCSKTGEETVNSVACEIWEGDFGFAPATVHFRFDVQKVQPFSIMRSSFEDAMLHHKTQLDFSHIRVGPIPKGVWNPNSTCTEPKCQVPLELVLLIDGSGSIGAGDFELMRQFATKVVEQFSLGPEDVRIGVVQFSSSATVQIDLSSNTADVTKAISGMGQARGSTNMDAGLNAVGNMIATKGRSNVVSATIMFTDGVPDSGTNPVAAAQKLKDKNIGVYTVGVGSGVNPGLLKDIASRPEETHAFLADNFAELQDLLTRLVDETCKGDTCAQK